MAQASSENTTTLPTTRREIERHIDSLIDLLDTIDADPDLEPSLGWTQPAGHWMEMPEDLLRNANAGDDREEDDEREPHEDSEPSLGWTDNPNQASAAWQANHLGTVDLEEGVGAVRKKRPTSRTGGKVLRGCAVLI